MTPYTVAHLKLSQYLKEICSVDFNDASNKLQILLTDTLDTTNEIRNNPILVILGNPPYNVKSENNGHNILNLMKDYEQIQEKTLTSLNDDYVKFIKWAEDKINKSKEGLLGIIINNGYLDNITFRGMRHHLLTTFDKIYILNLHGNSSRKKEKTNDGKEDKMYYLTLKQGFLFLFSSSTKKEQKRTS